MMTMMMLLLYVRHIRVKYVYIYTALCRHWRWWVICILTKLPPIKWIQTARFLFFGQIFPVLFNSTCLSWYWILTYIFISPFVYRVRIPYREKVTESTVIIYSNIISIHSLIFRYARLIRINRLLILTDIFFSLFRLLSATAGVDFSLFKYFCFVSGYFIFSYFGRCQFSGISLILSRHYIVASSSHKYTNKQSGGLSRKEQYIDNRAIEKLYNK